MRRRRVCLAESQRLGLAVDANPVLFKIVGPDAESLFSTVSCVQWQHNIRPQFISSDIGHRPSQSINTSGHAY